MTPAEHEALLRRAVVTGDWFSAERATRIMAWREMGRLLARGATRLASWAAPRKILWRSRA